jgi:hypothetical protein
VDGHGSGTGDEHEGQHRKDNDLLHFPLQIPLQSLPAISPFTLGMFVQSRRGFQRLNGDFW